MKIINNISSATLRVIYGNRNLYLSFLFSFFLRLEMYGRFATNIVIIKEVKICHPSSFVFPYPYPSLLGDYRREWLILEIATEGKREETPLFPPFVAVSTPKKHHLPG